MKFLVLLAVAFATLAYSFAQDECSTNEFACIIGGNCIPASDVCNSYADCYDSSDERGCDCTGMFTCNNTGMCIPESWHCDFYDDCGDSSDEIDCACDGFLCADGLDCFPSDYECDGYADCNDGSDESDTCPSTTTTTPGPCFECLDGSDCVPADYRCDDWADCDDNSDEADCPCDDGEVKCENGQCISEEHWCDADGIWDCNDGSDQGPGCGANATSTVKVHRLGLPKLSQLAREGKIVKSQYQKKLAILARKNRM